MNAADERRSRRANVVMHGTVRCGSQGFAVRVRNLSRHGALVISSAALEPESEIEFRCNGQSVPGWIAWTCGSLAGVQFAEPVDLTQLRGSAPPRIAIVEDSRAANFRRPGFRGNQLTVEERLAVREWVAKD